MLGHRAHNATLRLQGEALAKGIGIVQELGLDKRYGYRVKPLSAVAA